MALLWVYKEILIVCKAAGRQLNAKASHLVGAAGANLAAMQVDNFSGDSQTQTSAAGVAGAGTVQAEKFFKNALQLLWANCLTLV